LFKWRNSKHGRRAKNVKRIALIGGGGFANEVCEIANLLGYKIVGYVSKKIGIIDFPYWGNIDSLKKNKNNFDFVFIAFGSVDRISIENRLSVIQWITKEGFKSVSLVSPHATKSKGVKVLPGSIIAHGVVLSVDSIIEEYSIVNTNATIGHDAKIGQNVTVAPAAFIGGKATVGNNTLIGPGSIVLENRLIGSEVVVGMGGTVARNVPNGSTVMPIRSKVIK
jgi:acetyltransferase EpsM